MKKNYSKFWNASDQVEALLEVHETAEGALVDLMSQMCDAKNLSLEKKDYYISMLTPFYCETYRKIVEELRKL